MLGFILALATALSEASKDIFSKLNLRYVDEYMASFSMYLVITALLAPVILVIGVPQISSRFLLVLFSTSVIQLAVILLYMKAIKRSELSLTVPLITLSPLFMLISSPLLIGEFPSTWGLLGIILIVSGTYMLYMDGSNKGILAPFRNLIHQQGSRYMLIVAFLWSITANFDKIGVEETSPIFWIFSKDLLILLYLLPIVYYKSENALSQLKGRLWPLASVGVFRTASSLAQMFAIQYILVAYVIAIKRSSTLFIFLYAYFFLNEKKAFKTRLAAILTIFLGLLLITFS
jgi:uncharacterized membrane protein